MNIIDGICCILASFKFGVWILWGWHRHDEMWEQWKTIQMCCHMCFCLVL